MKQNERDSIASVAASQCEIALKSVAPASLQLCRCESITEGEIVDAIHRCFDKNMTLDGVKRRCRPGMGRCQGGFCGPRVQEIIARELGIKLEDINLEKDGSYILVGKTK